jgi:PTH1 family peptidyl-tRNA hydrolase
MQLWVGLGNPGLQYAMNRHNVGFMVADTLSDVYGFGPIQKKFLGWVQDGRIPGGGERIILLKPATFMNESGRSVGEAMRFYKLGMDALTVFHDELDLAPFKVKVKQALDRSASGTRFSPSAAGNWASGTQRPGDWLCPGQL